MKRFLAILLGVLAATAILGGNALAQPKPEFKLGFKALAEQVPDVVGEPLEEERWGANGDSLQRTSKGLMAWRKADNWTAFTNGSRTWINGPNGVQDRPNDERFEWEAAAPTAESPPPPSQPTPGPVEVQWKLYDRPELGFRLPIPASWAEMVASSGPPEQPAALYPATYTIFGAFDAVPRALGQDYGYVLVEGDQMPPGATLQDGLRDKLNSLNANPEVVKPVSSRQVATRSGEAGEVRYRLSRVVEGKTHTADTVWYMFVQGNQWYSLAGIAIGERVEGYLEIFERIGHDFELLPSQAAPRLPAPGAPFTPDMKAMDPQNAGPGATLKQLLLEVDGEWAGSWGWRPGWPVTVYLYADAGKMAEDVERVLGGRISPESREGLLREEAGSFRDAKGESAVLLTVKGASWGTPWEQTKARHNLLHEYAHVMVYDRGAESLPIWVVEGIAEYCAFARDPQAVGSFGRVTAATGLYNMSLLPGADRAMFPALRELSSGKWAAMVTSGEAGKRGAHGIAYLAVKYLVEKAGTGRVAQLLGAVAAGEAFEAALPRTTGYTVDQLDAEYRSTISRAGWPR